MITGLVIVNMTLLLIDMMVTEPTDCGIYGNSSIIQHCLDEFESSPGQVSWNNAFQLAEISFLSIFVIDILVRTYAYGFSYFNDVLNCIDALIVFSLFVVQVREMCAGLGTPHCWLCTRTI